MKIKVSTKQTTETLLAIGYIRKQADIVLTCTKCDMDYILRTSDDVGRKCVKCRAKAINSIDPQERGRYVTSLETLMGALMLGNDYRKELAAAKAMATKVKSPFAISIVVCKPAKRRAQS
jgi:chlorite dismutase